MTGDSEKDSKILGFRAVGGKFVYQGTEFTVVKIEPRSVSRPACIRCTHDDSGKWTSFYSHDAETLTKLDND